MIIFKILATIGWILLTINIWKDKLNSLEKTGVTLVIIFAMIIFWTNI